MTDFAAQELREEYLSRLDEAMRGLPHGVATDIRAGIDEELQGLDAAATAERIGRLGAPASIAREAHDETPGGPAIIVAGPLATARVPSTSTRGFAITAALVLSFGGIVLPVLGWFAGAVLVSLSALWKPWEKLVAIVVPLVAFAVTAVLLVTMQGFGTTAGSGSSTGTGPAEAVGVNPLVPAWYDLIWFGVILLGFVLIPASGLWLLWRLRGRTAR